MSSSASAQAQSRSLPKSRDGLALLLHTVQQLLEAAEAYQQRQRLRLAELQKLQRQADSIDLDQRLLSYIGDAGRRQWANGLPPNDCLIPHLDVERLGALVGDRDIVMQRLRRHPPGHSSVQLDAWLSDLTDVIRIDEAILDTYRDLRIQLLAALDDRADTSADASANFTKVMPKDFRVVTLFREIESNDDPTRSQNEIASDFAAKHGGNPASLLRSVRRFRERMRRIQSD